MGVDIERLKVDAAYWDEVAPDGAKWFGPDDYAYKEGWYRMMPREELCFLGSGDGVWEPISSSLREGAIPRPTAKSQEWDGTGLPPVGCECECWAHGEEWKSCRVVGHDVEAGIHAAVCRVEDKYHAFGVRCIRPIRTPEQRLGEELESVIRYRLKAGEIEGGIANAVLAILAKYNLAEK